MPALAETLVLIGGVFRPGDDGPMGGAGAGALILALPGAPFPMWKSRLCQQPFGRRAAFDALRSGERPDDPDRVLEGMFRAAHHDDTEPRHGTLPG